jgi:hypothetical protein
MGAETYARLRLALTHVEFATAAEIVRRIETAP